MELSSECDLLPVWLAPSLPQSLLTPAVSPPLLLSTEMPHCQNAMEDPWLCKPHKMDLWAGSSPWALCCQADALGRGCHFCIFTSSSDGFLLWHHSWCPAVSGFYADHLFLPGIVSPQGPGYSLLRWRGKAG